MSRVDPLVEAMRDVFNEESPIALALTEAATSKEELDLFLQHIATRMCIGAGGEQCVISHNDLMELRVKAGHYEDLSAAAIGAVREICVAMDANAAFIDDAVAQAINIAYDRGKAGKPLQRPEGAAPAPDDATE
jgi:hypothetical protein